MTPNQFIVAIEKFALDLAAKEKMAVYLEIDRRGNLPSIKIRVRTNYKVENYKVGKENPIKKLVSKHER